MNDEPSLPVVEKVFSVRFGLTETEAIQKLRLLRKPSLRRADAHNVVCQVSRVPAGQPVDRVAFGHETASLIDRPGKESSVTMRSLERRSEKGEVFP